MSERSNVQTGASSNDPTGGLYVPRWLLVAVLVVVALPFIMMGVMMLGMGLFGPVMHGGVAGPGSGMYWFAAFVPALLVLVLMYGVYRLAGNDQH